jgi:hypothetical protein
LEAEKKYSPMYFLAALGPGGLAVSFFMYVTFLIPHKGLPVVTYEQIVPAILKGDWLSYVTIVSLLFVVLFSIYHIKLVVWNIKQYNIFKTTKAFEELKKTNGKITLVTIPLTLAMSINVAFMMGAIFVPKLWTIVEYLFPAAILGFLIVGIYSLKIF